MSRLVSIVGVNAWNRFDQIRSTGPRETQKPRSMARKTWTSVSALGGVWFQDIVDTCLAT
jgi:hypothetical protein